LTDTTANIEPPLKVSTCRRGKNMSLNELYAKARLLKSAINDEYDLKRKQKLEEHYREVMEKISDYIDSAPF
jgi:hypothetical protein